MTIRQISITAIIFALAGLCSCKGKYNEPDGVIFANDNYTVYIDSVTIGDTTITAASLADTTVSTSYYPQYSSDQAIVNALYQRDLARIAPDSSKLFNPWSVMLSMAYIDPQRSMSSLRRHVRNGRILPASDSIKAWPLTSNRMAWTLAAYAVYNATGDRDWLREIYTITRNTLADDMMVLWNPACKLMRGETDFSGMYAGAYPAWMLPVDRYATMSLTTNALYARAFSVMAEMASLLDHDGSDYGAMSETIATSLNNRMWIPNLGYYSQYIYGGAYPIQSQATDCLGEALAVMTGIANEEMSRSVVAKTPVPTSGTPQVFPMSTAAGAAINPLVQAYWNLAAAKARNMQALRRGLGALYRLSATETDATADYAATAAIVMRVYAGMEFTADGIRFRPVVPHMLTGTKTITGLRYRDSDLTVRIHGTGVTVTKFTIDSLEVSDRIFPADMDGVHTVDIELAGDTPASQPVNIAAEAIMPPTPKVVWRDSNTATITNFTPGIAYNVYLNGILEEQIQTRTYSLYNAPEYTEVCFVPVAEETTVGYSMRPYRYMPRGAGFTIDAPDIAKGGTRLIKDRKLAKQFVALTIYRNRSLRFTFNAPEDGTYLISLRYANAGERCALRTLKVNGRDAGTLVMPIYGTGGWTGTTDSSTLSVHLNKGANAIGIDYPSLPGNNGTILLSKVCIIKQ